MNFRELLRLPQTRRFQRRERLSGRVTQAGLERLESRTLLAGDVTAALQGQNAVINGDAASNSIEVAVENGNVVVRGLDGTTVNGSTDTFVLITGATTVPRNLRISLGNGNDVVDVDGISVGNTLVVSGGNGNDQIGISNSTQVSGGLVVNGHRGNDTVSLQNSTVSGNAVLRGSQGNDMLIVSGSTIGRHLSVSGGRGHDDIVVDDSTVARDARLTGWSGNDDIIVRNSTISDDLAVVGHSGHDNIMIDTSTVADRSWILGRGGNDNVVVEGASRFTGRTRIAGGGGGDNFQAAAEATFGRLRRVSFSAFAPNAAFAARVTDTTTGAIAAAEAVVAGFDNRITLALSTATVAENAGAAASTLTVSRTGSSAAALDVTITSSDTTRLAAQQTSVTIPAGQTSVDVQLDPQDNSATDGDASITLTASAADFPDATIVVTVTDDETVTPGAATLSASTSQISEDTGGVDNVGSANTIDFELNVGTPVTADETYTVTYTLAGGGDATDVVTGPDEITIPANQSSVTYTVSTIANNIVDPDSVVTVAVSLDGSQVATTDVTIQDNDSARLTVALDQSSVTEDGPPATVTVTRNTDTTDELSVTLLVSDSSRVTVGGQATQTIVIPAGSNSTTQQLTTVDDDIDNGDVQVIVTATATGLTDGTATLQVVDNDDPTLNIVLPGTNVIAENAGTGALTATVTRNSGDVSSELTVALSVSGDSRLSVPASVVIPAGQSSVDVDFDAVDNDVVDNPSTGTATVTASSGGLADGTATVAITDDDTATFTISPATISVSESDGTGNLTLTRNSSGAAQDVTLTFSDTSLVTGPSSVTFAAGENIRTVQFTIIDNQSFDDNPDVTVTASSANSSDVSATISVANDDTLMLTTDFSTNNTVQSVGALVTKDQDFTITGQTSPGATVQVDTDGNAAFDEGTTVADASGNYSITVPLAHDDTNDGLNPVQVRAVVASSGAITTSDVTNVHRAIGTVIRFETNQDIDANGSNDFYDVELLDTDAPIAVTNFLSYVNDGSYDNIIIHRSPTNFVIQGGGFAVENSVVTRIPTRAAIQGEFTAANSNVRGTLSMAHTGDPNTGTSQWFVNVVNNNGTTTPTDLDAAGHTVFGEVIGNGMTVVDAINNISTADLSLVTNQSALTETPVANSPFTALTGTVSLTADSATLIGAGTAFTTELQVGDVIDVSGSQVVVMSIVSDTELTIDVQANGNQTSLPLRLVNTPPDTDYVIFSNIGEILDSV